MSDKIMIYILYGIAAERAYTEVTFGLHHANH